MFTLKGKFENQASLSSFYQSVSEDRALLFFLFVFLNVIWQGLGISPGRSPALGFVQMQLSYLKTSKATLTKNSRYPRTACI